MILCRNLQILELNTIRQKWSQLTKILITLLPSSSSCCCIICILASAAPVCLEGAITLGGGGGAAYSLWRALLLRAASRAAASAKGGKERGGKGREGEREREEREREGEGEGEEERERERKGRGGGGREKRDRLLKHTISKSIQDLATVGLYVTHPPFGLGIWHNFWTISYHNNLNNCTYRIKITPHTHRHTLSPTNVHCTVPTIFSMTLLALTHGSNFQLHTIKRSTSLSLPLKLKLRPCA